MNIKVKNKHLTYEHRIIIEALLKQNVNYKNISIIVGCSIATLYREIKRGLYYRIESELTEVLEYSSELAQNKYLYNQTAKGPDLKIKNNNDYLMEIEKHILNKYSPEASLILIGNKYNIRISKTTLYKYINDGMFENITNKNLPYGKRKR